MQFLQFYICYYSILWMVLLSSCYLDDVFTLFLAIYSYSYEWQRTYIPEMIVILVIFFAFLCPLCSNYAQTMPHFYQ